LKARADNASQVIVGESFDCLPIAFGIPAASAGEFHSLAQILRDYNLNVIFVTRNTLKLSINFVDEGFGPVLCFFSRISFICEKFELKEIVNSQDLV
jgi:hypothetical protein